MVSLTIEHIRHRTKTYPHDGCVLLTKRLSHHFLSICSITQHLLLAYLSFTYLVILDNLSMVQVVKRKTQTHIEPSQRDGCAIINKMTLSSVIQYRLLVHHSHRQQGTAIAFMPCWWVYQAHLAGPFY